MFGKKYSIQKIADVWKEGKVACGHRWGNGGWGELGG